MQVDIAAEVSDEIQKNLANQQQAEVQTEIDNQRKVSFQSSMKVAASFEPNKFAQALQLERKSGVPARVAYDNWGQVEQIKQQDKLDGLFSTAPRTADALSNPANAIVAKGDEDNLRNMELAVEKADFYQQGFFERQLAGPIRKWWDQDTLADTPGRLMQLDRLESAFNRVDAGEDIAGGFALDYRNADELGRKAMRDRISLQRNVALDKARVAQFDLEKAPVDPGDRAFQEAEGVTGALGAIADDPMWLGRVAAQSLPDMAQSLAAGLLNPILGGATEGATAANYKFLEVLQEKGIDPGDPVQLLQALRNDDLLSEASTRSARYGAGIGAVSIASFGLLGRVLAPSSVGGKPISQGAREWINAGVQVPVQGGLEALGELTGQVAERGQLSDVDGKEVVLEGIVGALMAGPEAGVFAGKRFTNHMIQARRAERAAGLQSDLVARSLESSTRKNDPVSFEAIVGQQLAGQPNEFIEIPAAKLQELNQSGMVNIPELLENVGIDPNHFTAQVELGGTIRMKNSSYLAYLSDHDELLASSVRVASNDYSLDDVQELDRQMVADMEKVVAQFGETDQMASAYSDVMGQLLSSGYERGAADTTARQYAAVMTRLAQQTGQTVEEVMTANPLNIAREIPQQVRRIKGDDLTLMLGRLRAGDIPQSADMFGKSLRDYLASAGGLDDTGGELAAFDADAGRVGRNRLARAGGQSLDDAAMAAWERGYFPGVAREDVTPNLLIDALREEAAGTPRYSVEQENATLRDQAASLEALQEFLDREGVDLASATDEEIRALLSGERQDDGQVLNQSALTPDQQRLVDMTEDEYIAAVNPENKRSDESDIVIVRAGDLDLPRGAELVDRSEDRSGQPVEVYVDDGGSLYAVQGGDVVGQIENRDGETLNIVTVEAQGKGIGSTLAAALIRRDPFAQAGSFSPAGEAARRSAFRKVKAELQGERRLNQSTVEITPQLEAEYSAAVSGGKRRAVIKMLEQAAGVEEVDASFDRDGAHDAPGPGAGSPIYDVTRDGTYPEDFYGPNGLKWYGAGDDTDGPAYAIIKGLEAAPNRPVKIYRAVPKDGAKKIVGGDWVATVRQYAKDHGEAALGGDYKILSMTVSARDLFTSGDSFAEYGYHPQPFKPEFPKSEAAKARTLAESAANFAAAHPESVGAETLQQSGDDDARGSITFGGRRGGVRRFDIRLGKKSDLSTVLHEMGHYYLEVIGDLVADGKANESLADDYGVILGWLGAEPGKMITVDQHEQFARGFEKYLAEGKAPSIELQGAFARFKRWLTGIYRDLRALNVELSPEVRGVFDRLLASEDAISEAQEALALSEQYESSITALMTPAELANYQRASQQARDEATTEIEQEILRAEIRKDQEWYREQKRIVEREVRDELEASQPYQARKWLFGNAPYPGLGKPLRLDSAAVTELFGSKSKEARFLGRARVREGGVHPEIAASMLGYINPSEMLNDMRAVPGLAEAIKIETERRMAERYPDPRVDGTLAEKAMAVVGEREAEVQAIQLRALAREAGRKASQHRIIKEAARQHIARLKLRDVTPYTFQRASTKAAKAVEAALLDGNMPKAYEEKEKQLMNLHLYREAVKAQDLAQKKRDQAKAYMKAGAKRKRLQSASVENYELAYPDGRVEYAATKAAANQAEADGAVVTPLFNFLEQVDGLLTKYEFGTPRRAIRQQREALATFLASMANESIVVNPPEWLLLDRAERTNWKELTIDELVDVVDMIRQIDQMAKNKLQVLRGDAWAEFEPLRDAIVATVELNASKARNSAFNKSFADEIRRWGREWLGTLPADQIARELDGQDELGPVQENITTPVQLAGRNALIREKAEHQGLADLIRQFYTDDQIKGMNDASRLIAIPEIGDSMTRMQMVMLMANMGNEGNRQALLSEARGIWTAETIQAVMAKLDSNDADFVEALWAWIDKFWPEVSENEARRTGVAPAKVQGTPYPVKLADGKIRVLKGGYFPLKYDGDLSIKTSQDEVANAFKNMTAGRTAKAYTPEGHKIERVGSGGRPVKLSFGVVTSHLNEVVRDIVMTDPVNQAWRFLHDRDVQSAFEKSNLKELFTALEIWMQDTAEGEVVDSSYTTAAARWLRTGFTANVMLFNLSNSLLNLAGTHPLVVLGKRWAFRGYRDSFDPANWNQMYELSTFMREARIDTFNKDLTLVQDQMAGKGGWRQAMTTAGFWLQNKLQMYMDAVTWMGAYQKGMSMDLVGADLVTYADQRVVEAAGSGVFADRSSLERGTLSRQTRQNELVRGLTTLAGYMIRKMAIARRRTAETSFKDIGQAMNWAVDMALLFTVEGLMFALVKGNIPDDEDEDQAVEWTKTAAWETAASIGGGLPPFGRPIVAGIQGFGGGSSSIDIFAEQFGNAVTQAKQGDADVTALKSVVALVGTATKTPGIATNRVIDWLDRAGEGETPPWYELFTGNRDK